MKILLTGATGYIGQLLLIRLLEEGHEVTCCVRRPAHFRIPEGREEQVDVRKVDFVNYDDDFKLFGKYDVAYYLIHSMSSSIKDFEQMEMKAAVNFRRLTDQSEVRHVVYLSGISNEDTLSPHLTSRFQVEQELRRGKVPVTVLRAGIIVGAGSASFELIRDLAEKLPVMIAPKWLHTRCQPISIDNVLDFLTGVVRKEEFFHKSYDIGGPDILTYKEMLLRYAKVRNLARYIWTVPFMTPRLSSYWLYFVTTVSYPLAVNLVQSMKVEVICRPNQLEKALGIQLLPYRESVAKALKLYNGDEVLSSWKDALSSSYQGVSIDQYTEVPEYGCLTDKKDLDITGKQKQILDNIWSIGGQRGWYYGTWLWQIRGIIDKLFGGIGLRRGRTHDNRLEPGDALDFWRVLVADKDSGRLLLFAEMKLPGEAWLEFKVKKEGGKHRLYQTATYRPKGLWGRLYWYMVLPFHVFVFNGMIRKIAGFVSSPAA